MSFWKEQARLKFGRRIAVFTGIAKAKKADATRMIRQFCSRFWR